MSAGDVTILNESGEIAYVIRMTVADDEKVNLPRAEYGLDLFLDGWMGNIATVDTTTVSRLLACHRRSGRFCCCLRGERNRHIRWH